MFYILLVEYTLVNFLKQLFSWTFCKIYKVHFEKTLLSETDAFWTLFYDKFSKCTFI